MREVAKDVACRSHNVPTTTARRLEFSTWFWTGQVDLWFTNSDGQYATPVSVSAIVKAGYDEAFFLNTRLD